MNRSPLMRTDASLRLREGDGSSATTPAVTAPASPALPAGSAPAMGTAPATATETAPGAPAPAVPSGAAVPPPSDSGATGTSSGATPVRGSPLPSGPAGAAGGAPGAGGRDADGRSGNSPQAPAGTGQGMRQAMSRGRRCPVWLRYLRRAPVCGHESRAGSTQTHRRCSPLRRQPLTAQPPLFQTRLLSRLRLIPRCPMARTA